MRTALYVRVSTDMQVEEGYSIGEQLDRLKDYCRSMDWTVHKEYVDGGYSGSNIYRPAMQELIRDANKKMFDAVVVYKLDRLSRSQQDTLYLIESVFNENDIAFHSLVESFDTSTPIGIAILGMMSIFAQLELSTITGRMHMGRVGRAKKGLYRGSTPPIGYTYKDDMLYIDDYEASQVKLIFNMFLAGNSINHIKDYMHENYTNKYGDYSYDSVIRRIITNDTYIGKVRYGGKSYNGVHEPIIDKDIFDTVNKMYNKRITDNNSPTNFNSRSLLSGYTYCSKCGGKVVRVSSSNNKYYYTCKNRAKKRVGDKDRCDCIRIRSTVLEKTIVDEIKKLKYNESYFDELKQPNVDYEQNNDVLYAEIDKLDNQISKLLELYSLGTIPIDAISSQIQALNDKKDKLLTLIENTPKIEEKLVKNDVMSIVDAVDTIFDSSELMEQRSYIQSLIEKIEIGEDIHIYWNF